MLDTTLSAQSPVWPSALPKPAMQPAKTTHLFHLIDDDPIFTEIFVRYLKKIAPRAVTHVFRNALDAIDALSDELPDLIFLDILLSGPDGFTYLNEISSYADTNVIPVILISSLYHRLPKMSSYNVVAYLDKTAFTPDDVKKAIGNAFLSQRAKNTSAARIAEPAIANQVTVASSTSGVRP